VRPSFWGKAASALQMIAVGWVMLQLPLHRYPIYAAGLVTLVSGIGYLFDGLAQLRHHDTPDA
jgi:phosphatidylglycerophosphate synthase